MIDDEKLQELLSKASSLYNGGQYRDAIEAWQAALAVDPSNQKASEGVRMATLLLGDWEPIANPASGDLQPPADGGDAAGQGLNQDEAEAELALGLAQVRQQIAGRNYEAAIEQARLLQAHAADSEEIQRLLDEAQTGYEAQPFVQEHLTLSRELLAQERFAEAEGECKKVFVLDREHPDAQALLKEIRERIQESLQRAARQMGGMTVKLSAADLGIPAPAPPVAAAPDAVFEVSEGLGVGSSSPDASAFSGMSEFDVPANDGDLAGTQEDVAARSLLDEAFAGLDAGETPAAPQAPGPEPGDAAFAPPREAPPEVVEAKTVVKPSVRLIPPATAGGGAASASPAAKTPAPPAKGSPTAAKAASSWEAELSQLNEKEGERGMLRGSAKKSGAPAAARKGAAPAPDPLADLDLMSLLDNDIGIPGATPAGSAGAPKPTRPTVAPGRAGQAATTMHTPPPRGAAKGHQGTAEFQGVETTPAEDAEAATAKARERNRPSPPPPRPRSAMPKVLALLVLILIAGAGAAWWFYFQPRSAAGASARDALGGSPPGGSAPASPDAGGPIPTPIGGSGRVPDQEPEEAAASSAIPLSAAIGGSQPVAPTGPAAMDVPGSPGVKAPPTEPIKPAAQPTLSPAEAKRRLTVYMADGRRLVQTGKWREARAKLTAALALDPVNFEAKEMLDTAQERIDAEQKILDEFESTRQLFDDKDYENALRKLYRLPRDKGLGDIDLYIQNTWYNWAVALLKAGNSRDALQKLSEVLVMNPDDAEALKLQEVAERYQNRAKDKVFYAFADGLKPRAMNAR